MKKVDLDEIKKFYNEVPEIWAEDDLWHLWSRKQIQKYLNKIPFSKQAIILNAGSGGNTYNISCAKMVHLDIAEEKIKGFENAVVSNLENIPFPSDTFDNIICVGSVINYCDAATSISEMSRVLKRGASLILEFENSAGFEYRGTPHYGKASTVVTVQFQGVEHTQWLYSYKYIKSLLKEYSLSVQNTFAYHICSSLALSFSGNSNSSYRMAKFDFLFRNIMPIATHANNFIIHCKKL